MRPEDFDYELPEALIAQAPLSRRSASRLLYLPAAGSVADHAFADLPGLLRPGDLLVLNDTRVIAARLYGRKPGGGRVEMLLERLVAPDRALAQLRANRAPRPGTRIDFDGGSVAEVRARRGRFFELEFDRPLAPVLEAHGHVPLPPYIRRADARQDAERYQTVYARQPGAVAAPTAGLHFDAPLFEALAARGIDTARLTLHVGAGTFAPLEEAQLAGRRLHAERLVVDEALCAAVSQARAGGGRVVAVGTTVVRGLEAAAADGELRPYDGDTELFIVPGDTFRVIDAMVTNFHLPRTSLLMLVCALGGSARVLDAYRHAVRQAYRFYSYGDAMLVERAQPR